MSSGIEFRYLPKRYVSSIFLTTVRDFKSCNIDRNEVKKSQTSSHTFVILQVGPDLLLLLDVFSPSRSHLNTKVLSHSSADK